MTSTLLPVGLGISSVSKVVTGEFTNAGSKDFCTMIDSTDDAKDAINWWVERLGSTLRGESSH